MNYQEAVTELARSRKGRRKVANNTYLHRVEDGIAVQLHATDVVVIHPDNTYTLNTGGWHTVTTKDRIRTYSPAKVYSERGIWYVGDYPYADGMTVDQNGTPLNPPTNGDDILRAKRALDRKVSRYIDGFAYDAVDNGLKTPSGGDCWGCCMTAEGNDDPMGLDHLFSHFEENYYVPSLLWKAINARKYGNPALVWQMISADVDRGNTRMLKDVLRSYFRKKKPALLELMMRVA